jgi:hypothetical protein
VSILDVLNEIWNQILAITGIFLMPDWKFVIGLIPILVLLGLVMPYLTGVAIGTTAYLATKPRTKVTFEVGSRMAEIGPGNEPVYPVGLPHCRRDRMIFQSGTTRCERCNDDLSVICPMCSLGRSAAITTCANCGLVLKVVPKAIAVRTTPGPKPGGAAAA